jgi:hypothetical protein
MDSNKKRKYWFFGSKLNTALLLILTILMVIALRWMSKNKQLYIPVNTTGALANDSSTINRIAKNIQGDFQLKACGPETISNSVSIPDFYILERIENSKKIFTILDSKGDLDKKIEFLSLRNDQGSCKIVFDLMYDKKFIQE